MIQSVDYLSSLFKRCDYYLLYDSSKSTAQTQNQTPLVQSGVSNGLEDNRQLSEKESKGQTRPRPEKHYVYSCFHDGSAGKESTCSAGDRDMGSIPGSGRSPGEEMATHSSILAWEVPWRLVGYSPLGCKESDITEHTHR